MNPRFRTRAKMRWEDDYYKPEINALPDLATFTHLHLSLRHMPVLKSAETPAETVRPGLERR